MKKPVNFYSEGVRLVGDVYYPDDLKTGAKHAGVVNSVLKQAGLKKER